MGIYKRKGSRYYWMSYTLDGIQQRVSTKTTSKALAVKISKRREGEIALGVFRVGWAGERMRFEDLCEEYRESHVSSLSNSSKDAFKSHEKHLVRFFGGRMLSEIDTPMIERYKNDRHQQRTKHNPDRTVKGATVNRELETLQCMMKMAVQRKYIGGNPASGIEHFPELRERPPKKRIAPEEFGRILEKSPPHLRVGILLLEQTGNRTYSELFSLTWSQIDLDAGIIRFDVPLKTKASGEPEPLSRLALDVLRWWKAQMNGISDFVFPSPRDPTKPIRSVKTAWRNTLKRAGIPHFPIYHLRHNFCTRVGRVASDAVVTKAMRHSSVETKRHYQLGMVEEVREAMNRANEALFGTLQQHIFSTVTSGSREQSQKKQPEAIEV